MVGTEEYSIGDEVVVWMLGEWRKVCVIGVHDDKVLLKDKNQQKCADTLESGMWVEKKSSFLRQEAICCIQ